MVEPGKKGVNMLTGYWQGVWPLTCVLWWYQATELTRLQTRKNGTANKLADRTMFHTQPRPPIFLNRLAETKPHTPEVTA